MKFKWREGGDNQQTPLLRGRASMLFPRIVVRGWKGVDMLIDKDRVSVGIHQDQTGGAGGGIKDCFGKMPKPAGETPTLPEK